MCGTVQYPPGFSPYTKITNTDDMQLHKIPKSGYPRFGTCINCERPGMNLWRGLCSACLYYVSGRDGHLKAPINSKQYWKQLRAYREKRWPEKFTSAKDYPKI
jgi:predicted amidophosphoribosyltransferase